MQTARISDLDEVLADLVEPKYDAFISHASEDKATLVRPLADRLRSLGARVWYDEFEVRPGDSLVEKIDEGLRLSATGILVISPAFLEKPWPRYERQGLTTLDVNRGGGALIPVWHNVTSRDVTAFSPTLAQRIALRTTDMSSVDELALRLLDVIRPELARGQRIRAAFEEAVASAEASGAESVEVKLLKPGPIVHEQLPPNLLSRIRLIQSALYEVLPKSYDETVDSFKRDLYTEAEVQNWESMAATYLTLVRASGVGALDGRREMFRLVLGGYTGQNLDDINTPNIPADFAAAVRDAFRERRRRYEQTAASGADSDDQLGGLSDPMHRTWTSASTPERSAIAP